jgi:hypothetical protein
MALAAYSCLRAAFLFYSIKRRDRKNAGETAVPAAFFRISSPNAMSFQVIDCFAVWNLMTIPNLESTLRASGLMPFRL